MQEKTIEILNKELEKAWKKYIETLFTKSYKENLKNIEELEKLINKLTVKKEILKYLEEESRDKTDKKEKDGENK